MRESTPKTACSRILGTGSYLPSRVMTNQDLESMVDTSDAWIVERTGIRERRIAAEDESTSDMAANASRRALEAAGVRADEIDLIIVGTVTPDMPLPSTAVMVQQKIGARNDCPSFDLAAACAGFIYGLSIADQFIRSGSAKRVLVVGVELLSRVINWKDRSTCVLFGDGAGAVVLGPGDGKRGVFSTHLYANGSLAGALCIPAGGTREPASRGSVEESRHTVRMNGQDIFKTAVKYLSAASEVALEANGLSAQEVDHVIPHQANIRILESVAKRCAIPIEKFYLNLDKYGNTSSASVPIALDEAVRDGTVREGDSLLLCALGGGVAWGSSFLRW